MDINSNNLVNMSVINNTKKFDNIKADNLEEEQLKKVSDEFEAFFLKQIMDISLKSTKVAGEGAGSDIIKGMYTQAVSDNSTGSLGISNMLYEFLSRNNKQG
tara:strand:- start:550 stop:855 length:306 start_codon:yes stop_codon:yes gene_type:complete